jgi:hypothetical protein
MIWSFCKYPVGADLGAAFAVNAAIPMVKESILFIGVKHQITSMRWFTPSAIPRITPETAINAMTGMYRKISVLTPVREVNVVEPVKFRARYAVTGGIMRSGVIAAMNLAHPGKSVPEAKAAANGIATTPPRRRPFVEKSFVGMNGSRIGKSTDPAITAETAASAATGPARNPSTAATTMAGSEM